MIGFHEGTLKFPNRNSFPYEILMAAPMTLLVPVTEDEVDHFSVWFKELSGYKLHISGTDTTTGIKLRMIHSQMHLQLKITGKSEFVNSSSLKQGA